MRPTYTVYTNLEKSKGKAHMNDLNELNDYLYTLHGKHQNVVVVNDQTGGERILDDNGEWWVIRKTPTPNQTFKEFYESEDANIDIDAFYKAKKKRDAEAAALLSREKNIEAPAEEGDLDIPTFLRKMRKPGPSLQEPDADIETPAYIRKDPKFIDMTDVEIPSAIRKAKAAEVQGLYADKSQPKSKKLPVKPPVPIIDPEKAKSQERLRKGFMGNNYE